MKKDAGGNTIKQRKQRRGQTDTKTENGPAGKRPNVCHLFDLGAAFLPPPWLPVFAFDADGGGPLTSTMSISEPDESDSTASSAFFFFASSFSLSFCAFATL